MRLTDFTLRQNDQEQVVSCRVEWETAQKPDFQIEIAIPSSLDLQLDPTPEAFLLAACAPAMTAGEERIFVDAPLCTLIKQSLPTAIEILRHWFPQRAPHAHAPRIESSGIKYDAGPSNRSTAGFFSGGVDSIHLLLRNAQDYPKGHPARIQHAICVYGFDMGGRQGKDGQPAYQALLSQSKGLLSALNTAAVPVRTNLRHLDDRTGFWGEIFVGFALSAVAHVFKPHFDIIHVASPGEPITAPVQTPFGTHPSLIPYTHSHATTIVMPYVECARQDKLACIAQSTLALDALRVCFSADTSNTGNCGRCEKCIRTQLGLMTSGIDPAPYFSGQELTLQAFNNIDIKFAVSIDLYEGFAANLPPKYAHLRPGITQLIHRARRYRRWIEGRTLGGRVRTALRRLNLLN